MDDAERTYKAGWDKCRRFTEQLVELVLSDMTEKQADKFCDRWEHHAPWLAQRMLDYPLADNWITGE